MIATTCGPNICILFLTIRTVMLLRGSNRSRKNLFQMSESLIDRYSSKATMLTLISIMLVVKFLTFRSLSFIVSSFKSANIICFLARHMGASFWFWKSSSHDYLLGRHQQFPHSFEQCNKLLYNLSFFKMATAENCATKYTEKRKTDLC